MPFFCTKVTKIQGWLQVYNIKISMENMPIIVTKHKLQKPFVKKDLVMPRCKTQSFSCFFVKEYIYIGTFTKGPIPNCLKSAELGNLGWGSGKLLPLSSQTKPWESILQTLNFNFLSSPNSFFFWEKPLAFCWTSCPATTHCSYGFDCYS